MGASKSKPSFRAALHKLKEGPVDLEQQTKCSEIWDGLVKSATMDRNSLEFAPNEENIFHYFSANDVLDIREKGNLQILFDEVRCHPLNVFCSLRETERRSLLEGH